MNVRQKNLEKLRLMVIFAMLGSIMFVSKLIMDALPNIHLVGALVMIYTIVYRAKALIPIYIFVFLTGLYGGFSLWWLPYLYVWTVLWGITMLLPKRTKPHIAVPVYVIVCALHGFLFGVLYAPAQAVLFGLSFEQMLAWMIAGIPFDIAHGIGNGVVGFLILPLSQALIKMEQRYRNIES